MELNPQVWGPHFWFVLHTITLSYPLTPNDVTKKKYYEFITNLPLFIPDAQMGTQFAQLIEEYPITAYLDNRNDFVTWMHFIHNKINKKLNIPVLSLNDFYYAYYDNYTRHPSTKGLYAKNADKTFYIPAWILRIFAIAGLIGTAFYLSKM